MEEFNPWGNTFHAWVLQKYGNQKEFSREMHVSHQFISALCKRVKPPQIKTMNRILLTLGISKEEFERGPQNPFPLCRPVTSVPRHNADTDGGHNPSDGDLKLSIIQLVTDTLKTMEADEVLQFKLMLEVYDAGIKSRKVVVSQ